MSPNINQDKKQIPIDFVDNALTKQSRSFSLSDGYNISNTLSLESIWVSMSNGEQIHLTHIFSKEKLKNQTNKIKVFMLHGEAESGDVFFNNKNNNMAALIADHGFDVFVADLPGRGRSLGSNEGYSNTTVHEIITEGIPKIISRIKKIDITKSFEKSNKISSKMVWIGHGFNSCLLTAAWSRLDQNSKSNINMIFFGARRKSTTKNISSRIIKFILRNNLISRLLILHGKFPSKKIKFGSCDESLNWYNVYKSWVKSESWIDLEDSYNYKVSLNNNPIPASLYFSCSDERFFGSILDTRYFIKDQGDHDARIFILNKKFNYKSMLTNSLAIEEVFTKLISWLKEKDIYPEQQNKYNPTEKNTFNPNKFEKIIS